MGTLIKPTTDFKRRSGGSFAAAVTVRRRSGGGWISATKAYRRTGGAWSMVYSMPDLGISGGGAATGSGGSSSGSASVGATAAPGGTNSGSLSYAWNYVSGDGAIAPNNSGIANPTFSRNFTGVPNGTTSSGVSAIWRCILTDTATGAQVYEDRTIGPLAWQNTIPAFSGRTDYINSSQSVSTPAGANSLTVYIVGGGAQGGAGFNDGMGTEFVGGGASGAGQAVKTVSGPGGSYSCTVGGGWVR